MCTCAGCMFGHVFMWRNHSIMQVWSPSGFFSTYTNIWVVIPYKWQSLEISVILKGENIVSDIFFLQRYFMFNVDISATKGLAGNISWMWTLWDDVLPSGSRCGMWRTFRLVCLLWPSPQARLGWASPPAFPTRWSFGHMRAFYDKRLQVMKSVLFLGRGNFCALVVGQDLCGLMSQLDLTARSKFCWLKKADVSCQLFGSKSALNSVIISLKMSGVNAPLPIFTG